MPSPSQQLPSIGEENSTADPKLLAAISELRSIIVALDAGNVVDGSLGLAELSQAAKDALTSGVAAPEAWRVVGAAGQPAYENGWTGTVRFKKVANVVYVTGVATRGSSATGNIFTLPAGYFPTGTGNDDSGLFAAITGNQTAASFGITAGAVNLPFTAQSRVSFNGTNFRVD